MKWLLSIFITVSLSAAVPAFADFSGRVVGVSDGDTITVLYDQEPVKVRLYGIDCPEKRQSFGERAKQFTSTSVFGQDVTIEEHGLDKYGRVLGDVLLLDGTILNESLLRAGLAWWYQKYTPKRSDLARLEAEARLERRGLWADPEPLPPWQWRKLRRN